MIQTLEDCSLNRGFWTPTNSLEHLARNFGANPLIFGTSHGTNKYALEFAAFGTVDKHGKTKVPSCFLLDREIEETFTWVFQNSYILLQKKFDEMYHLLVVCDPEVEIEIESRELETIPRTTILKS